MSVEPAGDRRLTPAGRGRPSRPMGGSLVQGFDPPAGRCHASAVAPATPPQLPRRAQGGAERFPCKRRVGGSLPPNSDPPGGAPQPFFDTYDG